MAEFELVLGLLLGGVALSMLGPRLGVPWPALLALAGAVLALVPGVPAVSLDPSLALALFVAPVLLDAAFDASPRDLRDNWLTLAGLVLVAVGLTVAAVAMAARFMDPAMPWAAAIALGAIVAPPDAAAATAVLRQVRLPHRLIVILEGESLLNDASALLVYRVAVVAAVGGTTAWTGPLAVAAALGGVALGFGLARLYRVVTVHVPRGPEAVVLQFLGTFGVWLLADALRLSAVLTVVTYAVTLSRTIGGQMGARARRSAYAVWEVAVFVLNVLAFILVGLQLRGIVERLDGQAGRYAGFALGVLVVVLAVRAAWVMGWNAVVRWRERHGPRRPTMPPTVSGGMVIAWCGMRGIVTLATALALPDGFPERDLIVFTAFGVVLGTLVLQGLTLRPLLARLSLPQDESVEHEVALARVEAARAGLAALGPDEGGEAGQWLRRKYQARLDAGATDSAIDPGGIGALRRRMLEAERASLLALRRADRIGDDAFHRLEEELDWAEADVDTGNAVR